MMLSDFDNALVNAEKALEIYKKTDSHHLADGYQMIGLIHYYKGDKKIAKEYFSSAKDIGAKIHPQIEKELFENETEEKEDEELQLDTPEDYARHEPDVLKSN